MPNILVANNELGTLDSLDELREPMIHSELLDYRIQPNTKYFSSAIRDSVASITSSGLLSKNANKI
jgi:hypothetical protein